MKKSINIMIKLKGDWEMYNSFIDASYDDKLRKIQHFKLHPELLPFVGANYDKYKVLLIGESHYIDLEKSSSKNDAFYDWYKESTKDVFIKSKSNSFEYFTHWFNTREVVNKFMCKKRTKAHHIFQYPGQIVQNKYDLASDSEAFSMMAFYNYFQRPNTIPGGSFKSMDTNFDEYNFAIETADEIFSKLQPNLIVFLSIKLKSTSILLLITSVITREA